FFYPSPIVACLYNEYSSSKHVVEGLKVVNYLSMRKIRLLIRRRLEEETLLRETRTEKYDVINDNNDGAACPNPKLKAGTHCQTSFLLR
ncbi:hypothetical protein V1477_009996, partial [Vespula maculifrons]